MGESVMALLQIVDESWSPRTTYNIFLDLSHSKEAALSRTGLAQDNGPQYQADPTGDLDLIPLE